MHLYMCMKMFKVYVRQDARADNFYVHAETHIKAFLLATKRAQSYNGVVLSIVEVK